MDKTLSYKKTRWLFNFEGKVIEIKVKAGDKVVVGQELAIVEEEECFSIDLSPYILRWSEISKGALRNELSGKKIVSGEFLVKGLNSPVEGVIDKVDEFMVAQIKLLTVHQKVITSPVDSVVKEVNKTSMELAFRALDVPISGLVEGKVWGNSRLLIIDKLSAIDYSMKGGIGFTSEFDRAMLVKAEVVGLVGMVIVSEKSDFTVGNLQLLLGVIPSAVFKQVMSKLGEEKAYRVLLNTKMGRMLFAVQ